MPDDPTPDDLDMAAELIAYGTPRFDDASVRIAEKLAMLREARTRIAELEAEVEGLKDELLAIRDPLKWATRKADA